MNKTKLFSVAVIAVFLMSVTAQTTLISAESSFIETNFELFYYTSSGSRTTESYALYIKQALAPLGIDVRIFAKPFGQFVGDLLHATSGRPFDLAHVRFGGGSPTPEFKWHYTSDSYFGSAMLQLHEPEFQEWQEKDIGYTTKQIDDMINEIDFELNISKRIELYDAFNQFYFDKLMYDLPLVARSFRTAVWAGYGGANNELWDPQEGIMGSRMLGAEWTSNPADRAAQGWNDTHMRLSTSTPNDIGLDPMQSADSAQTDITRYLQDSLLYFDKDFMPHPGIAWNFAYGSSNDTFEGLFDEDLDTNSSTPFYNTTKYTFFLRDDAFWSQTTDVDGNVIPAEVVDANDFVFLMDLYTTFINSSAYEVNGEDTYEYVLKYEASTTYTTNDTFSIWYDERFMTPDDVVNYGALAPLPEHILGGDLFWINSTKDAVANLTSPVKIGMPFDPWESEEWKQYSTLDGYSLVGPYKIIELEKGKYYSYKQRADYYFPNEWDVESFYQGNNAEMNAWEAEYDVNMSSWGPSDARLVDKQSAYYFAYDSTEALKVKPTTQTIDTFQFVVIDDTNAALIQFEAGNIDAFGSTALGAEQVEKHVKDQRFIVKTIIPNRGPELLIFNLMNPHLKKINVRLAISAALDRDKFVKIHDGFAEPWFAIAYPNSGDFDNIQATGVDYSYDTARDLMKLEGYAAAENNEVVPDVDIAGVEKVIEVISAPGFELWIALLSVFVLVPVIRKRK